jgi:hypothetical protein
MNTNLITADREVLIGLLGDAADVANDIPTMISLRKVDGSYTCEIVHPTTRETEL